MRLYRVKHADGVKQYVLAGDKKLVHRRMAEDGYADDYKIKKIADDDEETSLPRITIGLDKSTHRHPERGTYYTVDPRGPATVQLAPGRTISEGDLLEVYQAHEDGRLWARLHGEFHDGRFVPEVV